MYRDFLDIVKIRQMPKVIINAAITGMVPTKKDSPYVPITIREIVRDALKLAELGATIVHIHPRDNNGLPTWKKIYFEKIIGGIREKNDKLMISVNTSGRLWSEFEKRVECLDLKGDIKPDLASLTMGSMNFINQELMNSPEMIEKIALRIRERGIKPEIEIFEPGMIHKTNYLIGKGIIEDKKPYFNLFFGSLGTAPLHHSIVSSYLSLLPENAVWTGAGIGKFQLDANILSLSLGGGVRIGIEDNLYFDRKQTVLTSNIMLIQRIMKIIKLLNLEVSNANETKKLLF